MDERTANDYAIEHAEYLAKAVEAYMQSRISLDRALEAFENDEISEGDLQPFQESVSDHWHALEGCIYEFRKRAERAACEGRLPELPASALQYLRDGRSPL